MAEIATTKMSSKGQVVIPEDIRRRLGLRPGSQFVVVGERDTVVLKTISPPTMEEFDMLITAGRHFTFETIEFTSLSIYVIILHEPNCFSVQGLQVLFLLTRRREDSCTCV